METGTSPAVASIDNSLFNANFHVRSHSIIHGPPSTPLHRDMTAKVAQTPRSLLSPSTKHSRCPTKDLVELDEGYGSMPIINEVCKVLLTLEAGVIQSTDLEKVSVEGLQQQELPHATAPVSETCDKKEDAMPVMESQLREVEQPDPKPQVLRPMSSHSRHASTSSTKATHEKCSASSTIRRPEIQHTQLPEVHMPALIEEASQISISNDKADRIAFIDDDKEVDPEVVSPAHISAKTLPWPLDRFASNDPSLSMVGENNVAQSYTPLRKWAPMSNINQMADLGTTISELSLYDIASDCDSVLNNDADLLCKDNLISSKSSSDHELDLSSWDAKKEALSASSYIKQCTALGSQALTLTSICPVIQVKQFDEGLVGEDGYGAVAHPIILDSSRRASSSKAIVEYVETDDKASLSDLSNDSEIPPLSSQPPFKDASAKRLATDGGLKPITPRSSNAIKLKNGFRSMIDIEHDRLVGNIYSPKSVTGLQTSTETSYAARFSASIASKGTSSRYVDSIKPKSQSMYQLERFKLSLATVDDEEAETDTHSVPQSLGKMPSIKEAPIEPCSTTQDVVQNGSSSADTVIDTSKGRNWFRHHELHVPPLFKKLYKSAQLKSDPVNDPHSHESASNATTGNPSLISRLTGRKSSAYDVSSDISNSGLTESKPLHHHQLQPKPHAQKNKQQQHLHDDLVDVDQEKGSSASASWTNKSIKKKSVVAIHQGAIKPEVSATSDSGSSMNPVKSNVVLDKNGESHTASKEAAIDIAKPKNASDKRAFSLFEQTRKMVSPAISKPPITHNIQEEKIDGDSPLIKECGDSDIIAQFSAIEKRRFENNYKMIKQIGSGGHSTVWLAVRILDGQLVVCKFINTASVWNWHIEENGYSTNGYNTLVDSSTVPTKLPTNVLKNAKSPRDQCSNGSGSVDLNYPSLPQNPIECMTEVPSEPKRPMGSEKAKYESSIPGVTRYALSKLAAAVSSSMTVAANKPQSKPLPIRKIPLEIHQMRHFSKTRQPGLVKYYDHFEINPKFVIIMEYLGPDWVDLYDYIEMYGPVNESHVREIFGQIVETVSCLHRMGFCHNDIKDENIMIHTKTREIKLIDFGSTTHLKPGEPTNIFYGTKKFSSPEALYGKSYFPASQEIWALGTLLYVLLFQMDPFKDDIEVEELNIKHRIERLCSPLDLNSSRAKQGHSPIVVSDEAVELMSSLMYKDYHNRPTMENIIKFDFFKKKSVDCD
ncbi:hypothetical protein BASA50_002411 [Batrachochytrium salamandrivorans]|uniref:Protein kinase domain-containing protein n=1 Tax=Batrachochytrium salamandrivorans TaxID=1357716 RepID=A0ABQ8FLE8_9FUNG|nr:hypothetical protein BASA60_008759 [Batrachochytrium salamandrivorans]KAH6590594.1 hypothetical protein BASA61_005223 [Batrachochytrium salamandrivorans]KAH6600288.1 hypothetical protein BASA50_002411 [Batrachochytrium salamandrivorans]KAH9249325.1 hypothetical protein BASA81_012943 [Batrachochytrium salamandrivorans]